MIRWSTVSIRILNNFLLKKVRRQLSPKIHAALGIIYDIGDSYTHIIIVTAKNEPCISIRLYHEF